MRGEYEPLVAVYEWLVPDNLLEPEGAAAAFAQVLDGIPPPARVLDCAAGTGQLAVGLALRGYEVVATDVSPGMVGRTRTLAGQHGVALRVEACAWADLGGAGLEPFDAVFCVGNSLTHAQGTAGRRSALRAMRSVLRPGGLLAVTSRNWELVRAAGSGLALPSEVSVRNGIPGLTVLSWTIPPRWYEPHTVDVGVALLQGTAVTPHLSRLTFWPFTHDALQQDLRACGFQVRASSYGDSGDRYLVTATAD